MLSRLSISQQMEGKSISTIAADIMLGSVELGFWKRWTTFPRAMRGLQRAKKTSAGVKPDRMSLK